MMLTNLVSGTAVRPDRHDLVVTSSRFCLTCQVDISYRHHNARYCSLTCRNSLSLAYNPEYRRARYERERANGAHAARSAAWREKNSEKWRSYTAGWRNRYPDKARASYVRNRALRASAVVEEYSRIEVLNKAGWRCYMCGSKLRFETCHIDHLWPISRGGADCFVNVRAACARCNWAKAKKLPHEYAPCRIELADQEHPDLCEVPTCG